MAADKPTSGVPEDQDNAKERGFSVRRRLKAAAGGCLSYHPTHVRIRRAQPKPHRFPK
jgi:hypothetical protein